MNRVVRASLLRPPARPRLLVLALAAASFLLAAAPVFARTSSMPADPACLDADCADTEASTPDVQKAPGAERRASPSATRPAKPGNTRVNGSRKPRWHRYLPGMYR